MSSPTTRNTMSLVASTVVNTERYSQLAEPQPVDVPVDHPRSDQQRQHRHQCQPDQYSATPCQLRHPRRGPHPHS